MIVVIFELTPKNTHKAEYFDLAEALKTTLEELGSEADEDFSLDDFLSDDTLNDNALSNDV